MRQMPARCTMETPAARITVISLPRASEPRPTSAPMSAEIGSRSKANAGRRNSVNHIAPKAV